MTTTGNNDARRQIAGQASRYLAATVFSACVSLALPIALHEFARIAEELAVAISLVTAFIINFFVIRNFVFRSTAAIGQEFSRFFTVSIGFRIGEYLLFLALFKVLALNYIVSLVIALAISFVTKFVVQRKFVFNRPQS